jgi:hypothetical protein
MGNDNIITIEDDSGPYRLVLHNVMRMVPDKDKSDIALKRLLAFRLRTDGEGATRDYLMHQIRTMIQCAYTGRLYDFLKNDQQSRTCPPVDILHEPPDSA